MAVITLFAAASQATGAQLDDDLTLVSNQAPIPCTVSGTNALTLALKSNVYTVTAYGNNMQLSGVASGTNTSTVTAQLGSLGALNVYKDTTAGPAVLSGGEIVSGNAFTLLYDSTLNTGAGGWHLFTGTQDVGTAINPASLKLGVAGSVLSRYFSGTQSVTFSVMLAGAVQDFPVVIAGPLVGDAVILGPPSLTAQPIIYYGFVSAPSTITIRAVNAGSVSLTPNNGAWRVTGMG